MFSLSFTSDQSIVTGSTGVKAPVQLRGQRATEVVETNPSPVERMGLDAVHPVVHPIRQVSDDLEELYEERRLQSREMLRVRTVLQSNIRSLLEDQLEGLLLSLDGSSRYDRIQFLM